MYVEFTRPFYAKAIGLPLSLFLPNKRREKIITKLRATYAGDPLMSDTDLEHQVLFKVAIYYGFFIVF